MYVRSLSVMLLLALSGVVFAQETSWVERSNRHAEVMMAVRGAFQPEFTSFFGVSDYDEQVFDLGPRLGERYRAALGEARAELQRRLGDERDANVRQELDRYTFRSPGQATSYFYGYSRILELRAETVRTGFVPAQKTKARP